jgi:hypothetical protein
MMFLLRSAFWLSIVYAHMPWDGGEALSVVNETKSAVIASAAGAVADKCAENAAACRVIAAAVASTALPPVAPPPAAQRVAAKAKSLRPSANSLTASDLAPAWRGRQAKSGA